MVLDNDFSVGCRVYSFRVNLRVSCFMVGFRVDVLVSSVRVGFRVSGFRDAWLACWNRKNTWLACLLACFQLVGCWNRKNNPKKNGEHPNVKA